MSLEVRWQLEELRKDIRQLVSKEHETSIVVDRLERTVRELSTEIDGLRYELQELQANYQER